MKKTIYGKTYDTETATCLGYWSNNLSYSSFHYSEGTLYCTENYEYFLHGKGGAATIYASCDGLGGMRGGEDIVPMTREDAEKWAVEHLGTAKYEAIFGATD